MEARLNAHAPYSSGSNFRQFFYAIWYLGHTNFTQIVPGNPSAGKRG